MFIKKALLLVVAIVTFIFSSFSQTVGDDYLNDLINLWNNKKYDKVYQPLKDYKTSKKIEGDFGIDYMLASSLSRSNGNGEEVKKMVEEILKNYKLSAADAEYIKLLLTPAKYTTGANKRTDGERMANRGKGEKDSKDVPKSLGKGDGKADELEANTGGNEKENKEGKGSKDKAPADGRTSGEDSKIIRKPGITQIVKGDMVITVKPGWSYYVRNDSIYTIPPPKIKGAGK